MVGCKLDRAPSQCNSVQLGVTDKGSPGEEEAPSLCLKDSSPVALFQRGSDPHCFTGKDTDGFTQQEEATGGALRETHSLVGVTAAALVLGTMAAARVHSPLSAQARQTLTLECLGTVTVFPSVTWPRWMRTQSFGSSGGGCG